MLHLPRESGSKGSFVLDIRQFAFGLAGLAFLASPVHAASCAEGAGIVEQVAGTLDLSEAERSRVKALIAKAKAEDSQGRERSCKITLTGAIRFFLVRTVID